MDQFVIEKKNSHLVSCLSEVPADPKGIVIAVHGFASSKESATYQMLLEQFPKRGLGVIALDLPGHGTNESLSEELRIESCKDSLEAAEKYALEHYPGCPVVYFASSFGAYITALYISTREHTGRKAFFRSAAVNMPDLFVRRNPTEEDLKALEDLRKTGYLDIDMPPHRPVRLTFGMYKDLEGTDLFRCFDPEHFGAHSFLMVHGTEDTVIDPAKAKRFAEQYKIPIRFFEDEGHSLSDHPGTPEVVMDLAYRFFVNGETLCD